MSEWKMDRWKYFDITHRNHVVCNPTSIEKLDEMLSLLYLKPGARVVDIACGKAELLVRLTERFGIKGVGVGHIAVLHSAGGEEVSGTSSRRRP